MSVHKCKPWELDKNDYAEYKEVLPKDEDVQFTFIGWGLPANKSYLATCKQDIDRLPTGFERLKRRHERGRKRAGIPLASECPEVKL